MRAMSWLLTFCFSITVYADLYKSDVLYSGDKLAETRVSDLAASIRPGSIVIVSESHGFSPHHEKQLNALAALQAAGHRVSAGMEHFAYLDQPIVDRFLLGKLTEAEFLKQIGWGSLSFDFYRRQVFYPLQAGGTTIAINASRTLTGKIAKTGLESLSEQEKAQLPPQFTLGNSLYYERFREVMGEHVPKEKVERYFAAQSAWDDTMAWKSQNFVRANPEQVLVILVGDFHAAYGGGLPDRLKARGGAPVLTLSQVDLSSASEEQERELVEPSGRYGARADYVWVSRK